MKILAKDLTEEQQAVFYETFYSLEGSPNDDDINDISNPWGCPWAANEDEILEGETIEEMAVTYLATYQDEIDRILQEEKLWRIGEKDEDELFKMGADFIGWNGEVGDLSLNLYELSDGTEFITTNGPVAFDWEDGFRDSADTCTFPEKQ